MKTFDLKSEVLKETLYGSQSLQELGNKVAHTFSKKEILNAIQSWQFTETQSKNLQSIYDVVDKNKN